MSSASEPTVQQVADGTSPTQVPANAPRLTATRFSRARRHRTKPSKQNPHQSMPPDSTFSLRPSLAPEASTPERHSKTTAQSHDEPSFNKPPSSSALTAPVKSEPSTSTSASKSAAMRSARHPPDHEPQPNNDQPLSSRARLEVDKMPMFDSTKSVIIIHAFDELALKPDLLQGMRALNLEKPSLVQQHAIPPILQGRNVVVEARAETEIPAPFCVPVLQLTDTTLRETRALIISPIREVAIQIQSQILTLGGHMGIRCHACIGGTPIREDARLVQDGQHIISGTPGRVLDMINRGKLNASNIKILVLNEADGLLSKGFKDQVYKIHQRLDPSTQVMIFSATSSQDIMSMATELMTNPIHVAVKNEEQVHDDIIQFLITVKKEDHKFGALANLYDTIKTTQTVIFCNSRRNVNSLAKKMQAVNFSVVSLHRKMTQKECDDNMQEFRNGSSRVLITTDSWARGFDVQSVSLVINYDLPSNRESYIHRIGCSAQPGRKGVAINLVTKADGSMLRDIESFYSIQIAEVPANLAELI